MHLILLLAALQTAPELTSPLGKPLLPDPDEPKITEARKQYEAGAKDAAGLLALARAYDEQWRFRESIALYTEGMRKFPADFRFPRFRGHRYISTRRFAEAVKDLEVARKLAPSSFDVAYHLGLAHYLKGGYRKAAEAYGRCLAMAGQSGLRGDLPQGIRSCTELDREENSRVAIAEWQYRALRRAGRASDATALLGTIREGMKIGTNESYYKTLLFYKGVLREEAILPAAGQPLGNTFSTVGYGVGLHHLLAGRKPQACALFERITAERTWSAFGFIAAEGEIVRGVCRNRR